MARTYQPKYIQDPTTGERVLNPKYKPDSRTGDRHTVKNRHPHAGEEGYIPHSGSREESKYQVGQFIAWDGEGIDIRRGGKDVHVYALFMNSVGGAIDNAKGLSTHECLKLLTDCGKENPRAIHVCYGASYDVNMILKDVPYDDLITLYQGEKIVYDRYELEYRPRKSFTIRRMAEDVKERWHIKTVKGWMTDKQAKALGIAPALDKHGKTQHRKVYEVRMTLWDVLGFFQGAFIKALDSYFVKRDKSGDPNLEDPETARYVELIAEIKKGKDRRGSFTKQELEDFIKPYCRMEVDALVELMVKLKGYLTEAGLQIVRWDGAGACAAALLKREKIKDHMEEAPLAVRQAAQYAYAGGRIEPLQYGHYEGPVYHYDINSAYPAAMLHLPSLAGGTWKQKRKVSAADIAKLPPFSVFKISWAFPETLPAYPFAYRTKSGSILFPPHGKNWVWYPELAAALESIPDAARYIHIEQGWCFHPASLVKPFSFLPGLFDLRARWKKEGNGAEKALKLAINSLYGKMVQQLGYMTRNAREENAEEEDPTRDGSKTQGKPPYHQLEWGGYVTSFTRAMLFRAVMQAPKSIISLATDGIYSTVPLDLPCSKKLGEWDDNQHDNITLVTSGVYWYSNFEKLEDGTVKEHEHKFYRGFDSGTLTREWVLWSWENGYHSYRWLDQDGKMHTGAKSTRFITLGAALLVQPNAKEVSKQERFKDWRTWKTIDRQLGLDMSDVAKRLEVADYDQEKPPLPGDWSEGHPHTRLIKTRARTIRHLREEAQENRFPFPDTYTIEGTSVTILSERYKLKWEDENADQDSYVDGVPVFEYERQHLDTFV